MPTRNSTLTHRWSRLEGLKLRLLGRASPEPLPPTPVSRPGGAHKQQGYLHAPGLWSDTRDYQARTLNQTPSSAVSGVLLSQRSLFAFPNECTYINKYVTISRGSLTHLLFIKFSLFDRHISDPCVTPGVYPPAIALTLSLLLPLSLLFLLRVLLCVKGYVRQ